MTRVPQRWCGNSRQKDSKDSQERDKLPRNEDRSQNSEIKKVDLKCENTKVIEKELSWIKVMTKAFSKEK